MKIELFLDGPETLAAFADFLPKYTAAIAAQEARFAAQRPFGALGAAPSTAVTALYSEEADGTKAVTVTPAVGQPADDKPSAPTPTSRKPRKAAEPKAAPEPPAATPEPEAKAEPAVAEEVVTIDDVRRHLRIYGSEKGADALTTLYAEYGVQKLSDLPADKFAEIIAKVSA